MTSQVETFPVELKELRANGMTFRCRICGLENSGEPVILLHGFPETSYLWTEIMASLAAKGYRCLAPDQRGYSPKARPRSVDRYSIDQIAADVMALADAVGFQKFHLIGHDWGAGCGWTVVELYPERVNSWTALSIPHLGAFEAAKANNLDQKKKSWYMTFFQLPLLPEAMFGMATAKKPPSLWPTSSEAEVADYLTVFGNFAGRKATINWYRANRKLPIEYGDVSIPTLLIWGKQDVAIGHAAIEMTRPYMKGKYQLLELDAGHALVQEQFDTVNQAITDHLRQYPIAS